MDNIIDNQTCYKATITNIHWTAIIAGAFVGIGLSFLLHLFGMAIGLSAYNSVANTPPVIAIGGILGLLIGVLVSMGVAGFVAGYLGRFYHCYCHGGVIYGFLTWSLALLLSAILIKPLTHYVSFYEENLAPNVRPAQITDAGVNAVVTPSQNVAKPAVTNANPQKLEWSSWIIFILFFLGGLSSCISACYGMRCRKE